MVQSPGRVLDDARLASVYDVVKEIFTTLYKILYDVA
jgi:hypothetical protein